MNKKCVVCKRELQRKKTNKKTCSDACRKKLSRYRSMVVDNYWKLKDEVDRYAEMLQIDELHDTAYAVLEEISDKIERLLCQEQKTH